MDAERAGLDGEFASVRRRHPPLDREPHRARRHRRFLRHQRPRPVSRHQQPVRPVRPVEKRLGRHAHTRFTPYPLQRRTGLRDENRHAERLEGVDHRSRNPKVARGVIKSAVEFHMLKRRARVLPELGDLGQHRVSGFARADDPRLAPHGEPRVRADPDSARRSSFRQMRNRRRSPGVGAAGDIHGGDDLQEGEIGLGVGPLSGVGVEVDEARHG
ncbi:MAG: hypothetical protein FD180_2620 [Planctomycetota bacterium]|nr:MAG: hypothetical protein FD180_2620 [Planctomycetota bacterium]